MSYLKRVLTLVVTVLALAGCASLDGGTVTQINPFNQMHGQ